MRGRSKLLDDDLVETTLSTVLAYGSYLVADHIGAAGIIAVVCAGLAFGSVGRRFGLSEESRMHLDSVWRYVGFLANAVLFILIGLEIRISVLWTEIRWALLAVAVAPPLISRNGGPDAQGDTCIMVKVHTS